MRIANENVNDVGELSPTSFTSSEDLGHTWPTPNSWERAEKKEQEDIFFII